MANFSDIVKYQRSQGAGVIGSLATAVGQSTLQKIDPRNYLFSRTGMASSLFPFLKGYQAKASQPKTSVPKLQPTPTPVFDKETISRIKRIDIHTRIGAKNSMVLPMMARDMNVMRQNIQKMTKQSTGSSVRKADMFFKRAPERESAFKSAEKKEGGLLEGLVSGTGGLVGGLGNLAGGMLGFLGKTLSLGPFGIIGLVTGGLLAYNLIKKINFASIGNAFGGIGDSISYTIKSLFGIQDKEKPLMDIISDKLKDMLGIKDKNKGLLESLIESLTTNLDKLFGTTIFRKLFIEVKYTFNEFLLEAERFFEEASVTFDQMLEEIQRFAAMGLGAIGGAGATGMVMDLLSFSPYGRGAKVAGSIGSKLFNFVRKSRTGRGITTVAGGALGALTADEILEYVKSKEGKSDIQNLVDMGKISEAEKNYILEMPELNKKIESAQAGVNLAQKAFSSFQALDPYQQTDTERKRLESALQDRKDILEALLAAQKVITDQAAAGGAQFKPGMEFLDQINEAKRAGRERKYGARRQDLRRQRSEELDAVKPSTPTPVTPSGTGTPVTNMEGYLRSIRRGESGDNYDSVYSPTGKQTKLKIGDKLLSESTIQEVIDWQKKERAKETNTHALGAYGFINVEYAAKLAGLKGSDIFNKENQDKLAIALTEENRKILQGAGITPSFGDLAAAHGVGAAGFQKLLEAQKEGRGEEIAADILNLYGAARKTNPHLVKPVNQVLKDFYARVGSPGTPAIQPQVPKPSETPSTPKTSFSSIFGFTQDDIKQKEMEIFEGIAQLLAGMGGQIGDMGNQIADALRQANPPQVVPVASSSPYNDFLRSYGIGDEFK